MIEQIANDSYPVFYHIEYLAAQGHLVHLDDTKVNILSKIKEYKYLKDIKSRKGTFTTGVISYYKDRTIYLNYSSPKHAGEKMSRLLNQREDESPGFTLFSSASYRWDTLYQAAPSSLENLRLYDS